jgi:hypothetical protein
MPPKKVIKEKATWTFQGKKEFTPPPLAIGFIYRIYNKTNGMSYIGKKNLQSFKGRGKKQITTESNWKIYEGSSKYLKEDIKKGDIISKEILQFAFSKAELTYLETQSIICGGCLMDDKSYNRWIKATIYAHSLNSAKKISK